MELGRSILNPFPSPVSDHTLSLHPPHHALKFLVHASWDCGWQGWEEVPQQSIEHDHIISREFAEVEVP